MTHSILFGCLALGIILSVSFNYLAPDTIGHENEALQQSAFVKYQRQDGLRYKMIYEPHLLKKKLLAKNYTEAKIEQPDFNGHHYLTLAIDNESLNAAKNPVKNWEDFSEFLKDEFKNKFTLWINGQPKPCVLHHAFTMPQRKNNVTIQLVFKDDDFLGQLNYFKEATKITYTKTTGEILQWTFTAADLNSTPILNIKHNG